MYHARIKARMQKIGVNNGTLAALVGISAPKLSVYLKGRIELPADKRKLIDTVLKELDQMQVAVPMKINLTDAKLAELYLEIHRKGLFEPFRAVMPEFAKQVERMGDEI